jgi:hypothetical protein
VRTSGNIKDTISAQPAHSTAPLRLI